MVIDHYKLPTQKMKWLDISRRYGKSLMNNLKKIKVLFGSFQCYDLHIDTLPIHKTIKYTFHGCPIRQNGNRINICMYFY